MRFPDSPRQSWGINFMRNIRRKNEQVFWDSNRRVYGEMSDLEDNFNPEAGLSWA